MVEQINTEETQEVIDGESGLDQEEKQALEYLSEKTNEDLEKSFDREDLRDLLYAVEDERVGLSSQKEGYIEKSELISDISTKLLDVINSMEKGGDNDVENEDQKNKNEDVAKSKTDSSESNKQQEDAVADGSGMLDNATDKIASHNKRLDDFMQNNF